MKGGREDVDTPFWSRDTGFLGACWPKWSRESLNPPKIIFSERNTFFGGFRFSEFFWTQAGNSPSHIINENIFVFLNQLFVKYIEIYWNIFCHNFATGCPKDMIFLAPRLKSKLITTLFPKTIDFDQPLPRFLVTKSW